MQYENNNDEPNSILSTIMVSILSMLYNKNYIYIYIYIYIHSKALNITYGQIIF